MPCGFEKCHPLLQLSFRKLRELHGVTDENDDAQAQDFVETRLTDQVRPCSTPVNKDRGMMLRPVSIFYIGPTFPTLAGLPSVDLTLSSAYDVYT